MSIQTKIFQDGTAIRESLEQIDDVIIGPRYRIKAILHDFSYKGPFSTCKVRIKFYSMNKIRMPGAGVPKDPSEILKDKNHLKAYIESTRNVRSMKYTEDGIILSINTIKPIGVRKFTNDILDKINQHYREQN